MSDLFSRIAIGCAGWNQPYNGVQVPDKDIDKILGYCQSSGIDTLDMATAYGNDFNRPNSYFNKIIKIRKGDDIEKILESQPYCIMAHGLENNSCLYPEPKIDKWTGLINRGISLYSPNEMGAVRWEQKIGPPIHVMFGNTRFSPIEILQVPYSLYDRRWEIHFPEVHKHYKIHVRSIFLRGRIIEDGIPAEECIKFCLCNPYIDKVIIGADSFDQLRRNLDFLFKWKNLEKHDEKLLDTRKWD